jgi:hypothetical protein
LKNNLLLKIDFIKHEISFDDNGKDIISFACPKIPADLDAKIGVKKNNQNPDKKDYIFGYDFIQTPSIEPEFNIAIHCISTVIPGNAHEGKQLACHLEFLKQIPQLQFKPKLHMADAKFDEHNNFQAIRNLNAIPIISLNPRNQDLSPQALINRGYDPQGRPFAQCGIPCNINFGFDAETNRIASGCGKACPNSEIQNNCPYYRKRNGQIIKFNINHDPRTFLEIPRYSPRYQKIYALRNNSESQNAKICQPLHQLEKPKISSQIQAHHKTLWLDFSLLLTETTTFIAKCTKEFIEFSRPPPVQKIGRPKNQQKSISMDFQFPAFLNRCL